MNKSTNDIISERLNTAEANNRSHSLQAGAKKKQWGVDGYYVPDNDWMWERVKTFVPKMKKEHILEYIARKKKDLPAPNMYQTIQDWSKNNKGKFMKSQRSTEIDKILALKKNKPPGPGSYEPLKLVCQQPYVK